MAGYMDMDNAPEVIRDAWAPISDTTDARYVIVRVVAQSHNTRRRWPDHRPMDATARRVARGMRFFREFVDPFGQCRERMYIDRTQTRAPGTRP